MNCPFCELFHSRIVDRELVAENASAVAWLHESRAHRGHCVIAARRHVENLSELHAAEAVDFLELARAVEDAALAETGAERAILVKLGLQVPHLHLHIYPFTRESTREDVMKVIDGERTDQSTAEEKSEFAKRLRSHFQPGGAA